MRLRSSSPRRRPIQLELRESGPSAPRPARPTGCLHVAARLELASAAPREVIPSVGSPSPCASRRWRPSLSGIDEERNSYPWGHSGVGAIQVSVTILSLHRSPPAARPSHRVHRISLGVAIRSAAGPLPGVLRPHLEGVLVRLRDITSCVGHGKVSPAHSTECRRHSELGYPVGSVSVGAIQVSVTFLPSFAASPFGMPGATGSNRVSSASPSARRGAVARSVLARTSKGIRAVHQVITVARSWDAWLHSLLRPSTVERSRTPWGHLRGGAIHVSVPCFRLRPPPGPAACPEPPGPRHRPSPRTRSWRCPARLAWARKTTPGGLPCP